MLTYLLAPFLSLLPREWRKALPFTGIDWARAATLSGFAEFAVGVAAFMKWYAVVMNIWVNRGLDAAMNGKAGPGITDHVIGGAALIIWATHPVTLLLGCVVLEGAVRFCGATFSDSVLGTLPLVVIGKTISVFLPGKTNDDHIPNVASSFFGAIKDKVQESRLPVGADEIVAAQEGNDEILEIRASRRKADWDPPRVVRVRNTYYRLENFAKGAPPRPFRYTLRKLPAGVPGRSVLVYELDEGLVVK